MVLVGREEFWTVAILRRRLDCVFLIIHSLLVLHWSHWNFWSRQCDGSTGILWIRVLDGP